MSSVNVSASTLIRSLVRRRFSSRSSAHASLSLSRLCDPLARSYRNRGIAREDRDSRSTRVFPARPITADNLRGPLPRGSFPARIYNDGEGRPSSSPRQFARCKFDYEYYPPSRVDISLTIRPAFRAKSNARGIMQTRVGGENASRKRTAVSLPLSFSLSLVGKNSRAREENRTRPR